MSLLEEKRKWDDYAQHRRFLIAQSERSAGVSPDEAAKRRQTAQRLGVPVQAVNDAPENAVLQEQFDKIWRDTQGLGTLRGKMTDADFYDVAKDDTGSLGVMEKYARSFADGAVAGTGRMLSGTGEFLDAGWRSFLNAGKKLLLTEKGQNANFGRLEGDNFSEGWKAFGEPVKDFSKENIDIPDNRKNFGTNVANGLGQLVPNVLAAFAGGGLGAATSSLGQGADQMAEAVRNDDAPQQNKDLAVLGGAGFTALSEKFALDRMLPKGVGGTVLGRIGAGAAAEGVQETSENLVQDALQKYLTNPEHNIRLGEALEAGGVGATVGAIITSVAESAAGVRRRRGSRAAAEEHADHLKQQADNAAASKLTARAPDLQADFVNESYGEENNKLFFDAQTLMQSGLAETVAQAVPHLAPQIAEAVQTGGMVEMTRGDFHAFLPQETQHHLANIARMSPDAFSAAEAQAWEESEAAAEFEETARRAQEDAAAALRERQAFDALKAQFKGELLDTGRMDAKGADDAASLWASHVQAYAGRLNLTPEAFMERYGRLNVVGESLTRDGALNQSASAMKDTSANIRRGREAMNKALLDKADVNRAMYRNDLGWIDFVWGSEGTLKENGKTKGAMGLAHIIESRMRKDGMAYDDVARMLTHDITETIARGGKSKIYASGKSETVFVEYNGHRATLTKKQGNNGWLMNAFELHQDDGTAKSNDSAVPTRNSVTRHHGEAGASDAVSAYSTSNNTEALFFTSETEADIADGGNHTSDGLLFQDMTAEQAQFAETEAAYGGREAYEAAKADGKTELDYRQWVQVRTPAFKAWFGDWENDPDNASKVVNPKTGEPLVVYHNTEEQFHTFELSKARQNVDIPAFFFATNPETAEGYGSRSMQVFLNIRYPTRKPVIQTGKPGYALREELEREGFDGTIVDDSYEDYIDIEYAAFRPNQIKSATDNSGAFSADDDSILFQSAADKSVADILTGSPVAEIESGLIRRDENGKVIANAREFVRNWLAENRPDGVFHHPEVGDVVLTARGVKNSLSHLPADVHVNALPAVPYVLENSAVLEYSKDKDGAGVENVILAAPVNIGGERHYVVVRLRKDLKSGQKPQFYVVAAQLESEAHKEAALAVETRSARDGHIAGGKNRLLNILHSVLADVNRNLYQDARGMFDRMADTIALLKNADASTFIHEFGHFELETMSRIERDLRSVPPAEMTEGERQIVADFQTVLDWFGVKNADAWAAMTLDEQREHHEKFARGMEAYLFEGTAPSEALRGVFSRVARLLKRIYRTLAGLNVELSDDIREVFGRLLASDEQIAEAEYVNGMKLLLDEDGELRAMDEAARREAEDELGRRALRDMAFARNARSREIRRLKKEYKADFARAEMAARGSIMKQPVYRAWQLFTAKMTDENRIDGNSKEEREFRRKAKVLQGKPVYTIEKRTAPTDNKALRDWAADLFEKAGGKAVNQEIGEVALTRKSVKDSMAHGMNPFKAAAFEAVPSVIENGVVVAKADHDRLTSFFVSAPVRIMGEEDIVTVLVHKDMNTQKMYLHSVIAKENLLKTTPLIESTADTPVSEPRGGLQSGGIPNQALTGLDGDSAAGAGASEPRGKPDTEVLPTGKLQSEDVASVLSKLLAYKPKTDRTALDPSSDTLMAAIAKLGGLNKDELMREWGLDAKDKIPAPVFGMPVLRRSKGRSIDEMAELLAEEGYLPTDNGKADVRDLEERFSDGLSGRDWYSRHYVPREEKKAGEEVVNPYALNAVRLDESSLSDLPADWAQVLQERGMTAKTGGMHPDIAAGLILDENGEPVFSDGLDLVQALVEALPPQEAIEDTARLNLLAEKGEVPTQADFEEAADLAVHNEMRARIIAAELKRLNDARREIREEAVADEKVRRKIVNEELGGLKNFVKGVKREAVADEKVRTKIVTQETNRLNAAVGTVSLLKQAAKVLAKEKIEKMLVRDLRPSMFTRAEAAAARSSEKAFKAGDIEEAAAHKRNQLIQNALAAEALRTREEIRDLRRKISKTQERNRLRRKRAGNPNKGAVDLGYTEQISALLGYVGLAKAQAEREVLSIHTFVREMEAEGMAHNLDPEYIDRISRKSWREMTVEEMRGLADTVRQLEHLGRLKNRLLSNQAKHSYQEVRDELAGVLEASAKAQGRKAKVRREAATRWEKSAQWLSGVWWGHLKISTIARIFDDGKDNGAFFRHFILPLKQAADREATMTAEAAEKLYAVLQPLAKHTGRLKGMLERKRDYQGLGRLTREQLFAVALNMGNAGNLQRLLDGSGWHLADVERAVSTLTAEEWHAVQGVWDLLESYRPQIAALERRMTGVEPDWVEARPFKIMSADGVEVELRGGYYPAKYDLEADGAAEKNEASTEALAQAGAAGLAAATRRTFTKQRADQVKGRPLRLSLNVAYDAFNEIIHDLTHREAIADANRLLNSHTLDTLIRQHYGAAAKRQLTEAVKDIAAGNSGAAQALDTISARLRQNVSVAGLGFNVTSAAMQLIGIVPAMTRLGAAYTGKALATYFAHPVKSTRGANELSEMMANRTRTRFRELNEVANSVNGSDGIIRRYAYWMMMRMQQIVDTIVWHGAMMKAQDAGMAQEDAVQVADQTVLDTQGGGQAKDLSALERGGATTKLFTVFYSYMNTALNMGAATAMTERNKGKMAAHLLLQWVVPTALTTLFKSLLTPGDDDEDLRKKLAKEQISFMFGMFVGGRELAQLGDIATGGKFYGYSGPSGVRPIADTYKLAVQARQGEFDKGLATATINLLGSGFGLPSAQISRTLKGARALEEDKTDNPAALVFGYEGK